MLNLTKLYCQGLFFRLMDSQILSCDIKGLHLQTIVWLVYKTDDYRKKQIMQGIMQYNV